MALKKTKPAIDLLNEVLKLNPNHVDALVALANLIMAQKKADYTEAQMHINTALTIDPQHIGALLAQCQLLFNTGEYEDAKAKVIACLAIQHNSHATELLALQESITLALEEHKKKLAEAETVFNKARALHMDPRSNKKAIMQMYRQAIGLDPNHARAHANLATLYRSSDEANHELKAYNLFQRAIALDPTNAGFYYNFGCLLAEMDSKKDEGIQILNKGLSIYPNPYKAHLHAALGEILTDDVDQMIHHCKEAVALEPSMQVAHYLLFEAYSKKATLTDDGALDVVY